MSRSEIYYRKGVYTEDHQAAGPFRFRSAESADVLPPERG